MSKDTARGHYAEKPHQIPAKGWKDIALRVKDQLKYDHVQVVSAGVAFYFFMSLFPAIASAFFIYGLLVSPEQVQEQISKITLILPAQAHEMIGDIMKSMVSKSDDSLGWSAAISGVLSLYSAKKGVAALFEGINIAYDESDTRGFIKKNVIEMLFTLGTIVSGILAIFLIAAWPALIDNLGMPSVLQSIIDWGRWVLLAVMIIFSLSLIYKIAPDRDNPQFKWVSWGAILGTIFWIGGSLLFSWYVDNFGSYDSTYGSFAAVIILLLWLFLTAFIILLGAEINSEMEHQTRKDTTVGEYQPMGQRGAYHADHVAGKKAD